MLSSILELISQGIVFIFLYDTFYILILYVHSCKGLVEIFWRGKLDHHCTMESSSKTGTTRWGTSIQVTKKGVDAIAAFQQHGDPTRTYSYYQRVANLEAVLAKAGKRRKN